MTVYFLSQVRALDALLLGEEMAVTLGINATRKRYIYMACMALLTGVLVSQCGIIGFVGLVIPHMSRAFVGVGHKRLLPVVVLGGAIFLVLADLLSRVLLPAGDLPIGILTALMGGAALYETSLWFESEFWWLGAGMKEIIVKNLNYRAGNNQILNGFITHHSGR